jgi:hypothetical protein
MATDHPFSDPRLARAAAGHDPPMPAGIKAYAHVEGLLGEEAALLAVAKEERHEEHERRLREVTEELDRIWEHLRERAERHGDRRHLDDKG